MPTIQQVTYNWQYKRKADSRQTFWYDEARSYKSVEEAYEKEGKLLLACDKSRCRGHRVVMKIVTTDGRSVVIPVLYLLERNS